MWATLDTQAAAHRRTDVHNCNAQKVVESMLQNRFAILSYLSVTQHLHCSSVALCPQFVIGGNIIPTTDILTDLCITTNSDVSYTKYIALVVSRALSLSLSLSLSHSPQ